MSNRIFAAVGAAIIAVGGVIGLVAVGADSPEPTFAEYAAGDTPQVCPPGDSGKIDTTGDPQTVRITAPEGNVITAYCVKAGSVQSGAGVEFRQVVPPRRSLLITHSSGKDISHYSFEWKPCDCTTTTTTVPETTTTTVPETTTTTQPEVTTTTRPEVTTTTRPEVTTTTQPEVTTTTQPEVTTTTQPEVTTTTQPEVTTTTQPPRVTTTTQPNPTQVTLPSTQ